MLYLSIKNFEEISIIAAMSLEKPLFNDIIFPLFSAVTNLCSLDTCNIVNNS